jgi:hypothetical protein
MVSVSGKVKKPEILVGRLSVEIVTPSQSESICKPPKKREKNLARNNNMYSLILACILQAPHNLLI